ncbi:30S ribosome-binding factor RbfA [uncultured Traorella sp.]|uniref:30S ribosome-binding factor RbfA n=1 Tax=uncultured Traorella sp. TaxID=1929048 RepID=UPI0025F4A193|nr:30S ribosome-binding factor RbfA [uncultured Traorella sp.]
MTKNDKMNHIVQKAVSEIIQFELKNPKVGFITITDVQVTNDNSYAKIFVSFLGKEERAAAGLKALNQSKGFIRSALAKRLTIRKTPELIFEIDRSLERGNKIDKILNDLKQV